MHASQTQHNRDAPLGALQRKGAAQLDRDSGSTIR